jgi:hypothetical protein
LAESVLVTGAGGGAVLLTVVVGPGTTRVVSTTRVFGTGTGTGTGTGVATTPGDEGHVLGVLPRVVAALFAEEQPGRGALGRGEVERGAGHAVGSLGVSSAARYALKI